MEFIDALLIRYSFVWKENRHYEERNDDRLETKSASKNGRVEKAKSKYNITKSPIGELDIAENGLVPRTSSIEQIFEHLVVIAFIV